MSSPIAAALRASRQRTLALLDASGQRGRAWIIGFNAETMQYEDLVEAARTEAAEMLDGPPERVDAHLARWLSGREEFLKA